MATKPIVKFRYGNPPDSALTAAISRELYDLLRWVSRCPVIDGPAGTKAYIIKEDVMERAQKLCRRLEKLDPVRSKHI